MEGFALTRFLVRHTVMFDVVQIEINRIVGI